MILTMATTAPNRFRSVGLYFQTISWHLPILMGGPPFLSLFSLLLYNKEKKGMMEIRIPSLPELWRWVTVSSHHILMCRTGERRLRSRIPVTHRTALHCSPPRDIVRLNYVLALLGCHVVSSWPLIPWPLVNCCGTNSFLVLLHYQN